MFQFYGYGWWFLDDTLLRANLQFAGHISLEVKSTKMEICVILRIRATMREFDTLYVLKID